METNPVRSGPAESNVWHHNITIREFRGNLAACIGRVQWGGDRFQLIRHGEAVAALVSAADLKLLERIDNHGIAKVAEDLTDPLTVAANRSTSDWNALLAEWNRRLGRK